MRKLENVLITGGLGFIGSNLIRYLFNQKSFKGNIINVDNMTYAGNPMNLNDIASQGFSERYTFLKADICNREEIENFFLKYRIDTVIHLAAETHVDRSIDDPERFIQTNIIGTFNLLEASRKYWKNTQGNLFHHVSTDEVFGSLGAVGSFYEDTAYAPRSPYSASKASSDHLVLSYYHTYGLPVTISNCSNNYGPFQFPEKLIPLMISHALSERELPVYGGGRQIRDWLHVEDHCSALFAIIKNGVFGERYNIGGDEERENIDVVNLICEEISKISSKDINYYKKLITHVKDRLGHDQRYSINCEKIKRELGWKQSIGFDVGLKKTIAWYMHNHTWVDQIKNGEYQRVFTACTK